MEERKLNSTQFLEDFVEIEMFLKGFLNNPGVGFVQMVHMASKNHETVRRYHNELIEYAQLRNAIVHNRGGKDRAIAEPHDDVVSMLHGISKKLLEPKKVSQFMRKGIFKSYPDEFVLGMVNRQDEKHFSAVPVYSNSTYVGMVHPRLYQRWIASLKDQAHVDTLRVRDLLKFSKKTDRVIFVEETMSIHQLIDIYHNVQTKGKSVIAVLITSDGKISGKPLGILTVADLPIIYRELE